MKKAAVSIVEYRENAQNTSSYLQRQGEKLAEIARCLANSKDFSPCTINSMRALMGEMKAMQESLKVMVDTSVARGCTHYEEEKAKLLEGTLRLNRRESDQAAE